MTRQPHAVSLFRWSWLVFPAEMSPAERGALKFIIVGPRAWTERGVLDAAFPGAVDRLMLSGWVEPWEFPRYEATTLSVAEAAKRDIRVTDDPGAATEPMVTLSEWGAERLGVSLQEEWSYRTIVRREWAGPDRPHRKISRRAAENVSRWARSEVPPVDQPGPAPAIIQPAPEKPLPPHVVEVGLPIPRVKIIHKQADNPVLIDPDSGKPVRLFAGGREGAGLEVGIDRRLGKRR